MVINVLLHRLENEITERHLFFNSKDEFTFNDIQNYETLYKYKKI